MKQSRDSSYETSLKAIQLDPMMNDPAELSQDQIDHYLSVVEYEGGEYDALQTIADACKRDKYVVRWWSQSVMGNTDINKEHLAHLQRRGWSFVDGRRAEGYTYLAGAEPPARVEYKAMVLMERPKVIDDRAKAIEAAAAKGQLNNKLEEIGHRGTALGPITERSVQKKMERGSVVPD